MTTRLMNPITTNIDYSQEEEEFIRAMETYQRVNRRKFPTSREVLHVLKSLGYRKVIPPDNLPVFYHQKNGHTKDE